MNFNKEIRASCGLSNKILQKNRSILQKIPFLKTVALCRTNKGKTPLKFLNKICLSIIKRIVIGHISINSITNKFEMLSNMIKKNRCILMVTEAKLDCLFWNAQLVIQEHAAPFGYDRNPNVGGILFFVREDIPTKIRNKSLLRNF